MVRGLPLQVESVAWRTGGGTPPFWNLPCSPRVAKRDLVDRTGLGEHGLCSWGGARTPASDTIRTRAVTEVGPQDSRSLAGSDQEDATSLLGLARWLMVKAVMMTAAFDEPFPDAEPPAWYHDILAVGLRLLRRGGKLEVHVRSS